MTVAAMPTFPFNQYPQSHERLVSVWNSGVEMETDVVWNDQIPEKEGQKFCVYDIAISPGILNICNTMKATMPGILIVHF